MTARDQRNLVYAGVVIGTLLVVIVVQAVTIAALAATRDAAGDREASAPESQNRGPDRGPGGSAAGLARTAAPSDALRIRVSPQPASRGTPRPSLPKPATLRNEPSTRALFPEPWQTLAECESIGDLSWRPESPSTYRGYFQFLPSTWRSVGGSGDPAVASPAEQLHRARLLQARDGWSPWPVCSRRVGLR